MMVRHVIVVVGVDDGGMRVLVLRVPDDMLRDCGRLQGNTSLAGRTNSASPLVLSNGPFGAPPVIVDPSGSRRWACVCWSRCICIAPGSWGQAGRRRASGRARSPSDAAKYSRACQLNAPASQAAGTWAIL